MTPEEVKNLKLDDRLRFRGRDYAFYRLTPNGSVLMSHLPELEIVYGHEFDELGLVDDD